MGAEYDLDCPNRSCNGWMIIFVYNKGEEEEVHVVFLRCANSSKKIQLELAKSSASLQPNRKLVRPVCSKHIKRVSTLVVYYY